MTPVEQYLFTPIYQPRSAWAVVGWWELRRPLYNFLVGTAGLVTLTAAAVLEPGPPAMFLAFALGYGILANLCYSIGSLADLLLRRLLREQGYVMGPVLFRYGLAVSLALTLLPIPVLLFSRIVRVLF
jgi:hypothetical protein